MRTWIYLILCALVLLMPALAQNVVQYTTFIDPKGMFSMEVPARWYTQGNSFVDSMGATSYYVDTQSPDKTILICLGDSRIQAVYYTTSTPMMSGRQMAEYYFQKYIQPSSTGIQKKSSQDLQNGGGAVAYMVNQNVDGIVYFQTASSGNKWYIASMYNLIAPISEMQAVEAVCMHMIQTTRWNQQQQIVNNKLATSNALNQANTALQESNDMGNIIGHTMNQYSDIFSDNTPGQKYVWNCDGQQRTTNSYIPPASDCERIY